MNNLQTNLYDPYIEQVPTLWISYGIMEMKLWNYGNEGILYTHPELQNWSLTIRYSLVSYQGKLFLWWGRSYPSAVSVFQAQPLKTGKNQSPWKRNNFSCFKIILQFSRRYKK